MDTKTAEKIAIGSLLVSLFVCIATVFASIAAWIGANQTKLANMVELRPYVQIKLATDKLLHDQWGNSYAPYLGEPPFVVIPYRLENVGKAPGLNILKGYTSYLVDKESGRSTVIQSYKETIDKKDALLPSQPSAVHPDSINISGFAPLRRDDVLVRIELEIDYQGFVEVDSRTYFSKTILELYPQKNSKGDIVFLVSQPKLDFGFKNEALRIKQQDGFLHKEIKMDGNLIKLPDLSFFYWFGVLVATFIIRILLCFTKAVEIKLGGLEGQEKQFWKPWGLALISRANSKDVDDYFLPSMIGFVELTILPILLYNFWYSFIGGWIVIKTLGQWRSWNKFRTIYNRFILGNLLEIVAAYLIYKFYFV